MRLRGGIYPLLFPLLAGCSSEPIYPADDFKPPEADCQLSAETTNNLLQAYHNNLLASGAMVVNDKAVAERIQQVAGAAGAGSWSGYGLEVVVVRGGDAQSARITQLGPRVYMHEEMLDLIDATATSYVQAKDMSSGAYNATAFENTLSTYIAQSPSQTGAPALLPEQLSDQRRYSDMILGAYLARTLFHVLQGHTSEALCDLKEQSVSYKAIGTTTEGYVGFGELEELSADREGVHILHRSGALHPLGMLLLVAQNQALETAGSPDAYSLPTASERYLLVQDTMRSLGYVCVDLSCVQLPQGE